MEITSVVERFGEGIRRAEIDGQTMTVPIGPANRHHRAIEQWRARGGVVTLIPSAVLSADKFTIAADGIDQAVVSVAVAGADPLPASIDIEVGGLVESVALAGGAGQLPPITAETAGDIQVRAADPDAYFDQGGITIIAED